MNKFEKVFEILENTGTNWSAEKINLVTPCGKSTGSYGMFRSDNGEWLGTVKERYEPYQNSKLVETLVDACDSINLNLKKGGTLKNGSKVFYQIDLPMEYVGKSNVKRYITALNSHDGSTSIAFGSTNTVIVCQNTFFRAYREMEKVKHTINSHSRIEEMANNLKMTLSYDEKLFEQFKRMADIEMNDSIVQTLVNKLWKVDIQKNIDSLSTRSKNQIQTFANNLQTEIQLEGKTIWGLFNAVTRYTNHESAPKDELKKNDYLMNGSGATLSNLAFDTLLQYVENNSHEYVLINS
jgi:phage/plasmid-like protein (TIGR03299 family)